MAYRPNPAMALSLCLPSFHFIFPHPKTFFSLILEREEGRDEGREKNIHIREKHQLVASRTYPDQGSNPQPRYVP